MSKYTADFKLQIVQEYLGSAIGLTSLANKYGLQSSIIRFWCQRYRIHGLAAFERKYSTYTVDFKLSVLRHMKKHSLSLQETAAYFDLRGGSSVVSKWQRLYDEGGIDALKPRPKGRPKKMKSPIKKLDKNLSPAEQELKKLQREVEYLRAENAYLKKLDDLLRQKEQSKKNNQSKPKRK